MEIIKQTKLLNKKGHLTSPGWARSQVFNFNREKARPKLRLKEWDFYQIHTDEYILQMTIGHIGLASSFSAVLFSHKTGKRYSSGKYRPFPLIPKMPRNADLDHQVSLEKKSFSISFTVKNKVRHLQFKALDFEIDLRLSSFPEAEKLVIATPFEKPNQFYFNSKENCFKVSGYVRAKDLEVKFSDRDYGLLDWGRGVWPYRQTWTWGNASGLLDDGRTFGLNIGFGFGNLEQATENA
ncbi:MAG: DUF2804 domain-containing protein, partial [Bacilli bacterium]|nr:DUF2804 domain-containing protein [Bacilli bacterium]